MTMKAKNNGINVGVGVGKAQLDIYIYVGQLAKTDAIDAKLIAQ